MLEKTSQVPLAIRKRGRRKVVVSPVKRIGRQLAQPLPQTGIVWTAQLIPDYPSGNTDEITRPGHVPSRGVATAC
jgi:hypothetical protein